MTDRQILSWSLSLMDAGLEQARLDRVKAGHQDITFVKEDGVRWVGLYQSEWDDRCRARELILSLDA